MLGADLERRAEALVVVRRRQPDVDDRDVRRVAAHLQQEFVGGRRNYRRPRARSSLEQRVRALRAGARCPRRSRRARDLRSNARAATRAGSRLAAGRRAPPRGRRGRAGLSRARCRRRRPRRRRPRPRPGRSPASTSTDAEEAARVLADVGEALGDEVVGGDLERLGQPAVDDDRQANGDRRSRGELTRAQPRGRGR